MFQDIMTGLQEVLDDVKGLNNLPKQTITIEPIKQYTAENIKKIRNKTGYTQKLFAAYLGVSVKTVEAWESGKNVPNGTASRILSMIERDGETIVRYPFVRTEEG